MFEKQPSPAQLNANRENAKKSTGPTSDLGKSKSRRNASRHHLTGQVMTMTDEDRSAYEKFLKVFKADFRLETALETTLCEQVAHGFFRLGRINGLEENYFALQCDWKERDIRCEDPQISNAMLQALNFFANPEKFALLTLYEQRIHRKTHKDLKLLMDLQAKPAKQNPLLVRQEPTEAPEPEAEQALTATASGSESSTSPENGFVCSGASQAVPATDTDAKSTAPDRPNAA